ncbi:MAG TPA: MFS transporter [Holophagaceae bacterium]|nr:MFS transporter [Holophagaceae bacterium]
MTDPASDSLAALRVPDYRTFMGGMFGVFLATQIQTTVLGLQVYELARATRGVGDAAWAVGLIGLAEALPFLALTLFGGWASDHYDRRALSLWGLLGLLLGAAWLVQLNLGGAHALWPFYAVQAMAGVARALFRPASVALGTELIPVDLYANAATWRSTLFHIATVAGPALGALLYAWKGPLWTYGVMTAGYLAGFAALLALKPRPRPAAPATAILDSLKEGVAFVFSQQVVLAALSLDLFAVLFGGAVAMIPAFALDVLHAGPQSVGWLRAAPAAGAVLMGFWLARHGMFKRAGLTLIACVAGFGLTWIAFATSRSLGLSLALLALGGALDNVSVVLRATLVQTYTPQALMGRVSAVNSFFIGSSNELGAFESGLAAKALGLVPSVIFGGCMTLLTVGATAWRAPQLRRLRRIR